MKELECVFGSCELPAGLNAAAAFTLPSCGDPYSLEVMAGGCWSRSADGTDPSDPAVDLSPSFILPVNEPAASRTKSRGAGTRDGAAASRETFLF